MIQEKTVGTKTLEQLLAECPKPKGSDDPGQSMVELCDRLGMQEKAVRTRLRALLSRGELAVGRAHRQSISGVSIRVPVYRLAPKPKKK